MNVIAAVFSLLIALAGWYYMFHSQAAQQLAGVESNRNNRLRIRLRRITGLALLTMAIVFYSGITLMGDPPQPRTFLLWAVILFLLLLATLVLAMIDVRLTLRLGRRRKDGT